MAILHTHILGGLLALGGAVGLRAVPPSQRVQGQILWSGGLGAIEAPQKLKAFCFTVFFSEACAEIKTLCMTDFDGYDGSECAESRKDVPFGVKIFNVVLATGRQTTIKIIKIKQQFYC